MVNRIVNALMIKTILYLYSLFVTFAIYVCNNYDKMQISIIYAAFTIYYYYYPLSTRNVNASNIFDPTDILYREMRQSNPIAFCTIKLEFHHRTSHQPYI